MKKFFLLLSVCVLAQAHPHNLVFNGSFEQAMEGWAGVGQFETVNNPKIATDGDMCVRLHPLTNTAPYAVIMQWIPTIPGHTYECCMNVIYFSDSSNAPLQRVEFSITGRATWMQLLSVQPVWTNLLNNRFCKGAWTADSDRSLLQVRDMSLVGYPARCFIDNVSVTEVGGMMPVQVPKDVAAADIP